MFCGLICVNLSPFLTLCNHAEQRRAEAANATKLIAIVEDPDCDLPADAIPTLKVLVAALVQLEAEIDKLDVEISRRAKENEFARRLMTVPGIGPLIATAIATLAPPPENFRKARDFAAWPGLTLRQHSTAASSGSGPSRRWASALCDAC